MAYIELTSKTNFRVLLVPATLYSEIMHSDWLKLSHMTVSNIQSLCFITVANLLAYYDRKLQLYSPTD